MPEKIYLVTNLFSAKKRCLPKMQKLGLKEQFRRAFNWKLHTVALTLFSQN